MTEVTPIPRICSTCRKVNVCKIYEGMIGTQVAWDARFKEMLKFPLDPESIAKLCNEYENPTQVIKIGDASLT